MSIDNPTPDELLRLGNEQWAEAEALGVSDEVFNDVAPHSPLRDVSNDHRQDAMERHPSSQEDSEHPADKLAAPPNYDPPVKLRLASRYVKAGKANLPPVRQALKAAIKPDPEAVRREAANAALLEQANRIRAQKAIDAAKAIVETQKDDEA